MVWIGCYHLNRFVTLNFRLPQASAYELFLPAKYFIGLKKLMRDSRLPCKVDNSLFDESCSYLLLPQYSIYRTLMEYVLMQLSSTAAMNLPGWDVRYFIPSYGFADSMPNNSLVEGILLSQALNRLRYEEFVADGSKKKQACSQSDGHMCIKVMSYNVLAQTLLENHMFLYANISPTLLEWNFRYPRILGQISSEDPDIICLQEVQESHLNDFTRNFRDLGYKGMFKKKTGNKTDGCAIYYKSNRFNLVDVAFVEYFRPRVSLLNRDNVGLILRLSLNGSAGNDLVIATTHLLFNPRRHDVRLAQMQLFLAEIQRIANGGNCSVILTGDLNSLPDSLIVKLITEGSVQPFHRPLPSHLGILPTCKFADPETVKSFYNEHLGYDKGMTNDTQTSPEGRRTNESFILSHEFNFQSVYPFRQNNTPIATTYQDEWVTVDYMFYSFDDKIELLSRLRLPTSIECYHNIRYLPNYGNPSDHLPLIATFSLAVE